VKDNVIYTIGHSNRSLETFLALLQSQAIALLVDVRTIPRSRHNPQFAADTLAPALAAADIAYQHLATLGGLRRGLGQASPNTGWRNASFRSYADYMQTEAFQAGLGTLIDLARARPVAIMCAEALYWRCHRSLIADALLVRGWTVWHIMDEHHVRPHALTPFARVHGLQIIYPAADIS